MATGDNDGIEPLNPPIILLSTILSERHLPLVSDLLSAFHGGVIRYQILVSIAVHKSLNVSLHDRPMAERGIMAM
jgi:hypothetical protein